MDETNSPSNYVRKLFFQSQTQSSSGSLREDDDNSSTTVNVTKLRYDDWNNRLMSFTTQHDYLSHIFELSPGEDCPVKVIDSVNSSLTSDDVQKFCPGYIRRHDHTTAWYSPMRVFGSQSSSNHWSLTDLYGNHLDTFVSEEHIKAVWGVWVKSPFTNDNIDDSTHGIQEHHATVHHDESTHQQDSSFLGDTNTTNSNDSPTIVFTNSEDRSMEDDDSHIFSGGVDEVDITSSVRGR